MRSIRSHLPYRGVRFLFYKEVSIKSVPGSTKLSAERENLCEYLSRCARAEIVQLLIGKLGSVAEVARRVGVTEGAVRKWLNSTHPSNSRLKLLLRLAIEIEREHTCRILERDFQNYRNALANFKKI